MSERLAPIQAALRGRAPLAGGVLGALLFVASVLLILTGKPSAANLALGLFGVLAMTPAAYALLGRPVRDKPGRPT